MEQKHTPGPWIYGPEVGPDCTRIDAENGLVIAAVRSREITSWEQSRPIYSWSDEGAANARLIAAAPDLLAALERLSFAAECRDNTMGDACRLIEVKAELASANQQARAAIAKATGQ